MPPEELTKLPIGAQLTVIVDETHLAPRLAQEITATFAPLFQQAEKVLEEAATVSVTDPTDLRGMKRAGDLRKTLKHIRTTAEKSRVAMTADALKVKQTIDMVARTLRTELEAAEGYLESQEKLAERLQAEREAKLKAERAQMLESLNVNPDLYNLGAMPEPDWQRLLEHARADYAAAREAAAQAERDRVAREQAAEQERARLRAENERLRAEQAEKDRIAAEERRKAKAEQDRLQRERDEAEAQVQRDREAARANAQAAQREADAKAEAARKAEAAKAAAAAAKAKAEADAKLAAEAAKRKAIEAAADEMLELLWFAHDTLEGRGDKAVPTVLAKLKSTLARIDPQ